MAGDYALAIETSNPSAGGAGVAIAKTLKTGLKLQGVEPVHAAHRHSDDLMPAIDRLCTRLGTGPRDFGLVLVSAGPGGYTGLRIAIVTAQAIAEIAGAGCIGVESDRVVAQRVEPDGRAFAVCLASKGQTTFARVYEPDRTPKGDGRLIRSTDVASLGVELLIADRHLPAPIREAAQRAGLEPREPRFDPTALFEIGADMRASPPEGLRPIYPREPDAVTQWRARQASGFRSRGSANGC
jgi:tRNA threonylcarbamoyladenosine biosynthesis protein TsaB